MLKFFSTNNQVDDYKTNQFSIYNKRTDCDYEIFNLNKILSQEKEEKVIFYSGDFFEFEDCKLKKHKPLKQDSIISRGDYIYFQNNNIKTEYKFSILQQSIKDKIKTKSFQTFYQKIKLIIEFEKFNISSKKLMLSVLEEVSRTVSFFYMTLVAFLFFAKVPKRGQLVLRVFSSICFVATIYIFNLIITGWITQSYTFSPVLILSSSVVTFFVVLAAILYKKI